MIARRAIAPLHHPLNRYAVTGGALRRFLVVVPSIVNVIYTVGVYWGSVL